MAEPPPPGSPSGGEHADGVVLQLLPSQLATVELAGPHVITAHMAEQLRRNFVRVLVGDRVRVELMPADKTRGRIVEKL